VGVEKEGEDSLPPPPASLANRGGGGVKKTFFKLEFSARVMVVQGKEASAREGNTAGSQD